MAALEEPQARRPVPAERPKDRELGLDRLTFFFGAIDAIFAADDSDILDKRFDFFPGGWAVFLQVGKTSLVDFTASGGVTKQQARSKNDGAQPQTASGRHDHDLDILRVIASINTRSPRALLRH